MYQFKYAYQVGWVWGDIYDGIKRLAKLGYQGVEVAGQPEYFSQAQQIGNRLLLIPRNNQRQRQAVYICIKRIGKCYGNTDCGVNIVALTDVE